MPHPARTSPATHPLRSRHVAALLAGGRDGVLSHHSAARVRRLPVPHDPAEHISVPRSARRTTTTLEVHRCRPLTLDDRITIDGLRTTSVPRTLLDLADVLDDRPFERAVADAQITTCSTRPRSPS